jgi:hypothetical protein
VVWWSFFSKSRTKSVKKIFPKEMIKKKKEKTWGWLIKTIIEKQKENVFN